MALYDQIGSSYSRTRLTDPRILAKITSALEGCGRVLNVGAGTGSYEPEGRHVISVEPSSVMMKQRTGPFEGLRAVVEYLPFPDESFDAAMGVNTIHHWTDRVQGLREMRRVVKDRIVIFAWDQAKISKSWLLGDYFPASRELASRRFVPLGIYKKVLGGSVDFVPVPVPWDCMDGSDGAYWRRPSEVLRESVWRNLSILSLIPPDERAKGMRRLALELGNGTWKRKYGHLLKLNEFDYGFLLVVWRKR
ncbi:MAG: class I SAM-dependent methyltransferase [Nitrososphaerota archaeon]|nr:class I SAM-dependent methyltransferase [Nitrososphaerota archaeon]